VPWLVLLSKREERCAQRLCEGKGRWVEGAGCDEGSLREEIASCTLAKSEWGAC